MVLDDSVGLLQMPPMVNVLEGWAFIACEKLLFTSPAPQLYSPGVVQLVHHTVMHLRTINLTMGLDALRSSEDS